MTTMTARAHRAVSDVDKNMMGIRSTSLYELLKKVVIEGDLEALNQNEPEKVLSEVIGHITVTIPEDIFRREQGDEIAEFERLRSELSALGDYLKREFQAKGTYPFTIVRICEICYDPFKYFKVYELKKFVSAMTSCCLVKSSWSFIGDACKANGGKFSNGDSDQEDVSLTKIAWIDDETEKQLVPFIKEIDSIMGANLGFEGGDDDDNMDVEMNDYDGRNEHDNFIIEDYYEDAPARENDQDDDDEDGDYVDGANSEDDEDEVDDEEDFDEDGSAQTTPTTRESPKAAGKRKPTEVDDFDYEDKTARYTRVATPKKLKAQSADEDRPEPQISRLEQTVSIAVSPNNRDQEAEGNI